MIKDPTSNLTRLRELEEKVERLIVAQLLMIDAGELVATTLKQIADKFEEQDRAQAELAETY